MWRMKRKIAILAVCLMGFVCPNAKTQTVDTAEAQTRAKRFWDSVLTRCGQSYFTQVDVPGNSYVFEFTGVTFRVVPEALSDADRKNGTKWLGRASLRASTYRQFDRKSGTWGLWENGKFDRNGNRIYYKHEGMDSMSPEETDDLARGKEQVEGYGGYISFSIIQTDTGWSDIVNKENISGGLRKPAESSCAALARPSRIVADEKSEHDSYTDELQKETERMKRELGVPSAQAPKGP
jgi:hypothetical protein